MRDGSWSLILLLLFCSAAVAAEELPTEEEQSEPSHSRPRRYAYGYDYGYGGEYWYAGRLFGILAGAILFLLCCCAPCVCLAGIWFLGWFGIRTAQQKKKQRQNIHHVFEGSRPVESNFVRPYEDERRPASPIPPPHPLRSSMRQSRSQPRIHSTAEFQPSDQIIYQAEDRFYSSSSNSPPDIRPTGCRATRF